MVTGAGGDGAFRSVEVFNPSTNTTCHGPDLPDNRAAHTTGETPAPVSPLTALFIADLTDAGLVTCGGLSRNTQTMTCIRLPSPGATEWEHYADIGSRRWHTSWWTPSGKLLLLGGYDGSNYLSSTELVGDGTSPFTLQRAAE